jgi:hypothetical protein
MEHVQRVYADLETIAAKGTPRDSVRFLGLRE